MKRFDIGDHVQWINGGTGNAQTGCVTVVDDEQRTLIVRYDDRPNDTAVVTFGGATILPLTKHDPVHSPAHYTAGGIETIDFIEAKELDYHLGNVVKYVSRAGRKGDAVEDLKKARWYLDRAIEKTKT